MGRSPLRSKAVDASALEVVAAFERAGIPLLLLKGPALSRLLYRADEQRSYIDLDVLVSPGHHADARVAVSGLGYELQPDRGVDDFLGVLHAESWYRPSPDGALIDLHWRLVGCAAPPQEVWDRLYAEHGTLAIGCRRVPILGRSALALHVATHVAQHGPQDQKALADLERGAQRWPLDTWQAASRLAAEVGASDALAAGLRAHPAGAQVAEELGLRPTPSLSWQMLNLNRRPRGAFHLDALIDAPTFGQRVRVLRRALLPRRTWIAWTYPGSDRSRARLLLAYGRHLLNAPGWALRAWRYRRQLPR